MDADKATARGTATVDRIRVEQILRVTALARVEGIGIGILEGRDESATGPGGTGGRVVLARRQPAFGRTAVTRAYRYALVIPLEDHVGHATHRIRAVDRRRTVRHDFQPLDCVHRDSADVHG